jgi:hypothetical protein
MAHVGNRYLKAKPGRYQKVCDRYHQFAKDVLAHNPNLHELIIVGDETQNTLRGFGIWESEMHAHAMEKTQEFTKFMSDITDDLDEALHRNDLRLLFHKNPKA